MLTTILNPTSGDITLNGHDAADDADAVRHSFGIVFQDPSLDDDLTAIENMNLHGVLYGVPEQGAQGADRDSCSILWNYGIGATVR